MVGKGNPAAGKYPIAAAALGLLLAGAFTPSPLGQQAIKRLGEAEDITRCDSIFKESDYAAFITVQAIVV